MIRALRTWLANFRADQRGVSAVEFAFIAPVMILFYFGIVEIGQVTMAERRTVRTASSIADILAQSNATITPAEIDQVLGISNVLMSPFPTGDDLKVCVAGITADANNVKTVAWRRLTNGAPCPTEDSIVTDNLSGLIDANQSLVMARVTYNYTGPTHQVLSQDITFTKTYYFRPRKVQTITCPAC